MAGFSNFALGGDSAADSGNAGPVSAMRLNLKRASVGLAAPWRGMDQLRNDPGFFVARAVSARANLCFSNFAVCGTVIA